MPELTQAEEFWTTMYPFLFPEASFRLAESEIDKILTLIDFKGRSILDLACGPGRHTTVLAKKGFQVTGVDCSPLLLEKAKERAGTHNVDVELVQQDMRDFSRPDTYDLALSMFTSFGYFDDRQDDIRVLRNIHRSLVPGGALVMDLFGKEVLARNFQPISQEGPLGQFGIGSGESLIESHEVYDGWNRLRNQWLLIRGDRVKTYQFDHWIYSGQELKDRLEQVGFTKVKLAGDLRGNDYGVNATRLLVIAWK